MTLNKYLAGIFLVLSACLGKPVLAETYCNTGHSLSGTTCNYSYTTTSCPAGYSSNGSQCVMYSSYGATANTTYSCSSGTLSGSSCLISTTTSPSTTYRCEDSRATLSGTTCTLRLYLSDGQPWDVTQAAIASTSCPSGYSLSGGTCTGSYSASATPTTTYSCPSGGYLSGTACQLSYTTALIYHNNNASYAAYQRTSGSLTATDGSKSNVIDLTWYGSSGATGYDIQYRKNSGAWSILASPTSSSYGYSTTDYSTFEFQVRAKNSHGTAAWSPVDSGWAAKTCVSGVISWGGGSFCKFNVTSQGNVGDVRSMTNQTAGAVGGATATCNGLTGAWDVSGASCSVSLSGPSGLAATDGTVSYGINVSWSAVSGASSYKLEQRKQGSTGWTQLYAGSATSYNWTGLSDESVYEFQVTPVNVLGNGPVSGGETGHIRKLVDPVFVSQSGIPAKIGIGQSMTFSQVWKNNGAETWVGAGSYGTSAFAPADTSIWGKGFVAFPSGNTATDASVTASISVTAPGTPGKYNLQRIFRKSSVDYGTASPATEVLVLGNPVCTAVTPSASTFYNPNQTLTVTLDGANSVESAAVRVWTEANGQDDVRDYPATLDGGKWTATVDMKNHPGFGNVVLRGVVSNTLLGTNNNCASTTVMFAELPIPQLSLTPTMGSFTESGAQGFVTNRSSGLFAKATVSLPGFDGLKATIEVRDASGAVLGAPVANVPVAVATNLATTQTAGNAWADFAGSIRVSYSDANAAIQGKELVVPVRWKLSPVAMSVGLTFGDVLPLRAQTTVTAGGAYDAATHGGFAARLEFANREVYAEDRNADGLGQAAFESLDYKASYNRTVVGVMTAVPPAGVTLLQPMEFFSEVKKVPVQPPVTVTATDGTREDDVEVTWVEPAPGASIRYRIYRDAEDVTGNVLGVTGSSFLDKPPVRGQVYAYSVKSAVDGEESSQKASDTGYVPACRAPRLVGATLNADMTALSGLIQQWACLTTVEVMGSVDAGASSVITPTGAPDYLSFSYLVPAALPDGAHVFKVQVKAPEVTLNADRSYEIPFTLNRASITVGDVVITYDGAPATPGVETNSIGRMGVTVSGGTGIGFAEKVE